MKDVEFDEEDVLQIPVRKDPPATSVLAKELVKRKLLPTGKYANYFLVGLSILIFFIAFIFFALYTQTLAK